MEAVLTSKGQITLPKPLRDELGLDSGDRVQFVKSEHGYVLVPVKGDILSLRGMFDGRRAKPLTIEEMNEVIAEMGSSS